MALRATFFFQDSRGAGWTETLYNVGSDPTAVMVRAQSLKDFRRNLMGGRAKITYIRVSQDDPLRDAVVAAVPPLQGQGLYPGGTDPSGNTDAGFSSLLCRLVGVPTKNGRIFLRGVPDDIVGDSGQFINAATWVTRFTAYANELVAGGWAVRTINTSVQKFSVDTLTQIGSTAIVNGTTTVAHGWNIGDLVNFRGGIGGRGARGRHKLIQAGALSFTFQTPKLVTPYTGGMTGQKVVFDLTTIASIEPIRITKHNVGRPFGSPVGRRRSLV